MIDYRKEIEARNKLKDAMQSCFDENEKAMPLYDGILSYINKQNAQFEKMRAILLQNPQLARVINAMLNENITFTQALIKYVGADFATIDENSPEYYQILNAEIDRNEQMIIEQEIEEELHEKRELQAARIEVFCTQNGIDTADFIQDLNNCIVQPVIDSEMSYKDLLAYKIAIEARMFFDSAEKSKDLFADRKQRKRKLQTRAGIYYTNDGITYGVHNNGKIEVLPVVIKPNEPMYMYTDFFAEGVKTKEPKKWSAIKGALRYTKMWCDLENAEKNCLNKQNEDELAVLILKQCSEQPYFRKMAEEEEKHFKSTADHLNDITELAKKKSLKKAYTMFWQAVAENFNIKEVADTDVFKNSTVNEVLFPLND